MFELNFNSVSEKYNIKLKAVFLSLILIYSIFLGLPAQTVTAAPGNTPGNAPGQPGNFQISAFNAQGSQAVDGVGNIVKNKIVDSYLSNLSVSAPIGNFAPNGGTQQVKYYFDHNQDGKFNNSELIVNKTLTLGSNGIQGEPTVGKFVTFNPEDELNGAITGHGSRGIGVYSHRLETANDTVTRPVIVSNSPQFRPVDQNVREIAVRLAAERTNQSVEEVEIEFKQSPNDGQVIVRRMGGLPPTGDENFANMTSDISNISAEDTPVDRIDIRPPDSDIDANLSFTLNKSKFDSSGGAIRITRYNNSSSEYEELPTSVVSENNSEVTVSADTPGFSNFTVIDDESITPSNTDNPNDSNDSNDSSDDSFDDSDDSPDSDSTGEDTVNNQIATQTVSPTKDEVNFDTLGNQNDRIQSIQLDFEMPPSDQVSADVLDEPPTQTDYTGRSGTAIATVDIEVPESERDDPVTITISVDRSRVQETEADPESLNIEHFTGEQWKTLSTDTVSVTPDEVTVSAKTDQFSIFVVSYPVAAQTQTPTQTFTPTQTPIPPTSTDSVATDTMTQEPSPDEALTTEGNNPEVEVTTSSGSTPGFGILIAILTIALSIRLYIWQSM